MIVQCHHCKCELTRKNKIKKYTCTPCSQDLVGFKHTHLITPFTNKLYQKYLHGKPIQYISVEHKIDILDLYYVFSYYKRFNKYKCIKNYRNVFTK